MRKDGSNFNTYVWSFNWFRSTGFGLTLSRKACRYSRIVAYCLILASALALFNAAIQTVSSQTFNTSTGTDNSVETAQTTTTANATTTTNATQLTSTSTEITQTTTTSTATQFTRFTVAYATSSIYVTLYKVQYTTANNLFTIVNVQFTTMTTSVTQVEFAQPIGAPPLPASSSSGDPSMADALLGRGDVGLTLQLIAGSVIAIILLASAPLIRRERK
jgi:hypothetical protein